MTLFAGAFSRRQIEKLDDNLCGDLERTVSRVPADKPEVLRSRTCCLVKVDIRAYPEPGTRTDPDGFVTLIAGDPLLDEEIELAAGGRRGHSLDLLHATASQGRWDILSRANGVFSAVHYSPADGHLTLVSDKLGLRPLYYWIGPDLVVFASSLRVLEELPVVPKRMDLRGVIESRTLGVPLGIRTAYADISLLRAAEVLRISADGISRQQYWKWDDIEESGASEDDLITDAYHRFGRAVDRRLGTQRAVAAFLSGGLDSRVITAELLQRGTVVHTFNFARAGTQDQLLGKEFAAAAGSVHHEMPILERGANAKYAFTMSAALSATPPLHPDFPSLPRLAWSGDGGSIGVGHVRVDHEVVRLLRQGRRKDGVALFVEKQRARIPSRLFRPAVSRPLEAATSEGIHEELDDIHSRDPGRGFHLFLMLNDQRRHLADHFEHIDLHRLEYQLPFFDSRFLELMISVPLDRCLGHAFYSRWLQRFPEVVRTVPWQTYPGHVPCPLPIPPQLGYQWDPAVTTLNSAGARRDTRLAAVRNSLEAADFPDPILRKHMVRAAYWIYRLGIRDYGYAMDYVTTLHDHWRRCGGEFVLHGAPGQRPLDADGVKT
jgi:asparagine synthase (glutamine-hydrolysing)